MAGSVLKKDELIDKFITEVVERVRTNILTSDTTPANYYYLLGGTTPFAYTNPIYKKDATMQDGGPNNFIDKNFSIPGSYNTHFIAAGATNRKDLAERLFRFGLGEEEPDFDEYINEHELKGISLTIAGLIDLFQVYAYQLTRYRTIGLIDSIDVHTEIPVRMAILSSEWRMSADRFKTQLSAMTDLDNSTLILPEISAGAIVTDAQITRLFSQMYTIIESNANNVNVLDPNSLVFDAGAGCHSSCHGSCHGSRGRR